MISETAFNDTGNHAIPYEMEHIMISVTAFNNNPVPVTPQCVFPHIIKSNTLLCKVHCSTAASSAVDGCHTHCSTAAVRVADGRRTTNKSTQTYKHQRANT